MQQECHNDGDNCEWKGLPFTPEQKPIRTVRSVPVQGYWYYETFDQYGHTCTVSQGFDSEKSATTEAKADIKRTSKASRLRGSAWRSSWPPTTKVTGTKVT